MGEIVYVNFRSGSDAQARETAAQAADLAVQAARDALLREKRLAPGDRPILARNLGRLLEELADGAAPQARFIELAREAKGTDTPAFASLLNKRRRFVRWRGERLDGEFSSSGREYHSLIEKLAEIGKRSNETSAQAKRRLLLRLIEGASFDGAQLEKARTKDSAYADLLARIDALGRAVNDQADLYRYLDRLSEHPVYVQRAQLDRPGGFQWRPQEDRLSCQDDEMRPEGVSALVLGEELWSGEGALFFPGKSNQTGDLFSPLPHVLLGWLTVIDDLKAYEPDVVEGPDGGYVQGLFPVRGEPNGGWRAPLYLVLAPDLLGNIRPALLLDTVAALELPAPEHEVRIEPPTYVDLRSAHQETYLVIDGSEEARLLLASPQLDFEPAFMAPADTWTPLPYRSLGGMIQANLRSAPEDQRLDVRLAQDARERAQAVEQLFGAELQRYQAEMDRRWRT